MDRRTMLTAAGALAASLAFDAYRFSLEWARIEPEPDAFSRAMLDHYKAMVDGCRARGLTPVVTFNHFTVPRWFAARGGWTNPEAPAGLHAAMSDGLPVKGYVHWSLLDNYEWVFGYKPRFGLCSVDRTTFARTPKPSAAVLGAIARRNAL